MKSRYRFLILLLALQLTPASFTMAAGNSLNGIMSQIGIIMARQYPLLMFPREMDSRQIVQMQADLKQLDALFTQVEPFISDKTDAYQLTLAVVRENIKQAREAMQDRNDALARNRLRVTGTLCSACHSQDDRLRTLFFGIGRDAFEDDLSYAEFNFATRNYAEAEKFFRQYLYSDQLRDERDIQLSLRRLLTIYTQIFNRPSEGVKHLQPYLKLKAHSSNSRQYLEGVINGMKDLTREVDPDLGNIDFLKLEQMVMDTLGAYVTASPIMFSSPQEEVARVWLRGVLYRYLNQKAKSDEIPAILYWLSIVDRALSYNDDFSISEFYLKACVTRYPSHPFAKQCYVAYESYLRHFYTSPTEPVLPREVAEELSQLRSELK